MKQCKDLLRGDRVGDIEDMLWDFVDKSHLCGVAVLHPHCRIFESHEMWFTDIHLIISARDALISKA